MLQFVILLHIVESTVNADPHRWCVRIAIVLGSPMVDTQRMSFFYLSCTEVSFRMSTVSHSEALFGGHLFF